jgi:hypothetical protein
MTHQAHLLEDLQPAHAPSRTFFQRFGALGTCVLPADVLDATALVDPETCLAEPSLRQRCSRDGQLCYAHVLYTRTEGLYWTDVAATPDLAEAERVVLTEMDLTYALAWDERLYWRTHAQILRLMQAQAEDLAPLSPHPEPESPAALFPPPIVPLSIVTTVEITPDELREAFGATGADDPSGAHPCAGSRQPGVCRVQQGLLRALSQALQELLESATDRYITQVLRTLTALVKHVTRWQQHTRQRVVNAVRSWDAASSGLAWALTLGVPEALLRAV